MQDVQNMALVRVTLGRSGHFLSLTTTDIDDKNARLIPLRVDCYLARNAEAILADLQAALGRPQQTELAAELAGCAEPVRDPDRWHRFLPVEEWDGLRTAERILVQLACAGGAPDAAAAHAIACPIMERRVDATFVCALELL